MTEFYWHIHHEVLIEPATEPIENRIDYIKKNKPAHEIETRLRLLKPVRGKLPKEVIKAWKAYCKAWKAYCKARDAYCKAWKAYNKARDAYNKAWDAYYKALQNHKSEIEVLHKAECPNCPWNGKTIFPEGGNETSL